MKRREYLAAGAAVTAGMVAGCMGESEGELRLEDVDQWPPENYGTNVTIWNWFTTWRDRIIEHFQDDYPDIESYTLDAYNNPGQFYAAVQGDHSIDSIGSEGVFTRRMTEEGLLQPLPVDLMDNWDRIEAPIVEASEKYFAKDGEIYGIPTTRTLIPAIAYHSDYFDEPPDSWSIFWDEEYKNKMVMHDRDYVMSEIASWHLYGKQIPDDWDAVKEALLEQRPLNRTYYQDPNTIIELMANESILVAPMAQTWAIIGHETLTDKINVTVPQEGAVYSLDPLIVPKGAPNPIAGAMFADYALSDLSARIYWEEYYATTTHENANELKREFATESEYEVARWKDEWDLGPRIPYDSEQRDHLSDIYTAIVG
jgi:spermidine/putrescine transport system substrate-binding protein